MKGGVWISRRQLRWLLVLLALLPLVPTVLMVRLMVDNAQRDRDVVVSEAGSVYRDQLVRYVDRFSLASADDVESRGAENAEALAAYVSRIFGEGVSVRVQSSDGETVAEKRQPVTRDAFSTAVTEGVYAGWIVELDGYLDLPDSIDENLHDTYWKAAMVVSGVVVVAGLVYFIVNRRIRVDGLKADLMSTVSHEMKTPLASMRVMLETLSDGAVLDEDQREEYHRILLQENHRLSRLADQFLTSSRLERGEVRLPLSAVDLASLFQEVVASLKPQAREAGSVVELNVEDGAEMAVANRDALAAVLGNLLENAIKYGPVDSPIKLSAQLAEDGSDRLVVAVCDLGEPLEEDQAKRIFERFYQADDQLSRGGSGVGLGLSIAQKLTELMAGKIAWRTMDDRAAGHDWGNCFFIELPSASVATGRPAKASSPAKQASTHG